MPPQNPRLQQNMSLVLGLLPQAIRQALAIYADSHQTSEINRPFEANDDLIYVPRPNVTCNVEKTMDNYP